MSLDKQQILNELGSVMNKLQSADCGCMGKLFGNSPNGGNAQQGASLPTCGGCRRGCCSGHGYGVSHAGEPGNMGHSCNMNHCMTGHNAPKLYADTYSYLSKNLMHPVVNEVYNDLKSLSPNNTIANNPMANKMGLSQGGGGQNAANPMAGNAMGNQQMGYQQNMGHQSGNQQMEYQQMDNQAMGYQPMGNQQQMGYQQNMGYQNVGMAETGGQQMGEQMGNPYMNNQVVNNMQMGNQQGAGENNMANMMGGMGPNIMKMMTSAQKSAMGSARGRQPGAQGQEGGMTPMDGQNQQLAGNTGMPMAAPDMGNQQMQNMATPMTQYTTQDSTKMVNPYTQGITDPNVQEAVTKGHYHLHPGQVQQPNAGNKSYGQHAPGMNKFNEMFPALMKGDLGFDPMEIALQMNPANQKQSAMNTMQKMMAGGKDTKMPGAQQPAAAAPAQNQPTTNQQPVYQQQQQQPVYQQQQPVYQQQQPVYQQQQPVYQQQQQPAYQQQQQPVYQQQQLVYQQQQQPGHQQLQPLQNEINPEAVNAQQAPQGNLQYQQQVYPAGTGAATLPQAPLGTQQVVDPNTGAVMKHTPGQGYTPVANELIQQVNPASGYQPPLEQHVQDPNMGVDLSGNILSQPTYAPVKQEYVEYNTLGQPIELIPNTSYQNYQQQLQTPQTLSPQPVSNLRKDFNSLGLRNTMSKTSLMGMKPVGRTPSRNQLQRIYNQYKGSQSATQQNILPPVHTGTLSERNLYVPGKKLQAPAEVPVERVGGDTTLNNQIMNQNQVPVKDSPGAKPCNMTEGINQPHGDTMLNNEFGTKHGKLRNGLQDVKYTSYPVSSQSWSFHGGNSGR